MSKSSPRGKRTKKSTRHIPDREIDFSDVPELSKAQLGALERLTWPLKDEDPIRIRTRSGEAFILINEAQYAGMQKEIHSLRRRLFGMSDVVSGKVTEYKPGEKSRLARFLPGRKAKD